MVICFVLSGIEVLVSIKVVSSFGVFVIDSFGKTVVMGYLQDPR